MNIIYFLAGLFIGLYCWFLERDKRKTIETWRASDQQDIKFWRENYFKYVDKINKLLGIYTQKRKTK